MAFFNDWFKFSKPLPPTISGKNTRIELTAGPMSSQKGKATYNYNRQTLSRVGLDSIAVEGPTLAHILTKVNQITGLTIKEHDIKNPHFIVIPTKFQEHEIELVASELSPRWLGSIKMKVKWSPTDLSDYLSASILNGFYIHQLQSV